MMKYECWAYKNGKPFKMINVTANNRNEAEILAIQKFVDLEIAHDYVNVK